MNSDQIKGLRRQIAGLLLQACGHALRAETYIAKGRALRLRGYIQARLGSAMKMGQRRLRQWSVARAARMVRLQGHA